MSAASLFESVLWVFDALSFFDRVVAIVSSSPFRCRSVPRPTEARYQSRDNRLNAIIGHKIPEQGPRAQGRMSRPPTGAGLWFGLALGLPLRPQPMVKVASVRTAFIDPDEVSALPDPILVDPLSRLSRGGCQSGRLDPLHSAARWPLKAFPPGDVSSHWRSGTPRCAHFMTIKRHLLSPSSRRLLRAPKIWSN